MQIDGSDGDGLPLIRSAGVVRTGKPIVSGVVSLPGGAWPAVVSVTVTALSTPVLPRHPTGLFFVLAAHKQTACRGESASQQA